MTDLSQLIERVEAATEGSRELDALVYESVIGLRMYESIHERGGDLCLRYYPGPPGPEYGRLPRYSTSIDATLTLLPDNSIADVATTGVAWVDVTGDPCLHTAKCATAPLALLAAILRARQTEVHNG